MVNRKRDDTDAHTNMDALGHTRTNMDALRHTNMNTQSYLHHEFLHGIKKSIITVNK